MKIWIGHGSEHSFSLVLIGHFVDEANARRATERFRRLKAAAESEPPKQGWQTDERFSTGMLALLQELKLYELSPTDVDNFVFDHTVDVSGKEVRIETDEAEVQGFLKVLINGGAKIEIFSTHDWTADGRPHDDAKDEVPGAATED
jgi:hypothetical protein